MGIKEYVKEKLNTGKKVNTDFLLLNINQYKYISFDIFDTLLKRNVKNPTDIFEYIEIIYNIKDFKIKRIEAEKKARKNKNHVDVSIEDIYSCYSENKVLRKRLKEIELDTESRLLTVNYDLKKVYDECIKKGKIIFLVSDMYLPLKFVESILEREKISGYKKLYLSCCCNKTKRNGGLFQLLLKENGLKTEEIIHIGDSFNSDYKIPASAGIDVIHVPRYISRCSLHLKNKKSIKINILNSFINNNTPLDKDIYYRFGYEKFGMFLWGYVKWLKEQFLKEGIKKVYFLSRDGLIMKKAFDLINNSGTCSCYLEVSRRSLRVPILWLDYKFSTVLNMISPSKLISLKTIFDGVGLDIRKYYDLIIKYGFNMESVFDRKEIENNYKLKKMYKELTADIVQVSRDEYKMLIKYIVQNDLNGKFAIVDIGWSGGMQRYLDTTLEKMGIEHKIKGYYIGVADYYKRNSKVLPGLDLNGYLFDFSHDKNAEDKRSSFVGLFETLFLEQGGSVQNYYLDDNNLVKAKRYPYEYIQNGKPSREYRIVMKIQKGALLFVEQASKSRVFENINYTADELFEGLASTGGCPLKRDIDMFSDFRFVDEGETQCLAEPKSLFFYLLNPGKFKQDFLLSRWKTGFMKKILKVMLPYNKIYKMLLKFK